MNWRKALISSTLFFIPFIPLLLSTIGTTDHSREEEQKPRHYVMFRDYSYYVSPIYYVTPTLRLAGVWHHRIREAVYDSPPTRQGVKAYAEFLGATVFMEGGLLFLVFAFLGYASMMPPGRGQPPPREIDPIKELLPVWRAFKPFIMGWIALGILSAISIAVTMLHGYGYD